jgi:hypothetical protein
MTKTQIEITSQGGTVSISAPYSESNNEIFRSRGGKFDRDSSSWTFSDSPSVAAMVSDLFGDDSSLVTVSLQGSDLTQYGQGQFREVGNQWKLGGYVIGSRRFRDSRVESPEGVTLFEGNWESRGGSQKSPRVTSSGDIVIHAVVRRCFAERHNLNIVGQEQEVPTPEPIQETNPLAQYTDAQLIAELTRRGHLVEIIEEAK